LLLDSREKKLVGKLVGKETRIFWSHVLQADNSCVREKIPYLDFDLKIKSNIINEKWATEPKHTLLKAELGRMNSYQ